MLRILARALSRMLLGSAARAGRQVLDHDARIALTPRTLEDAMVAGTALPVDQPGAHVSETRPRRVGHLTVYEGGAKSMESSRSAPIGRPIPAEQVQRATAGAP